MSISEESDRNVDPTTIAISTANIFRGIVVDRNGVITSMNSRAMRSMKGENNGTAGGESKMKIGEKSRQAARIDKAKDLIDVVVENGGLGGGGDTMSDVSIWLLSNLREWILRGHFQHNVPHVPFPSTTLHLTK